MEIMKTDDRNVIHTKNSSMDLDNLDILDSIPDLSTYKTFTDRYFTKRYMLNVGGIESNNIMIMFHSNRITLLSLAPSHFFFKNRNNYKINFNVGNKDRLSNAVKGKGKKGGQNLGPKSIICKIEYDDGTSFDVPCCIKGRLLEINSNLVEKPLLLRERPDAEGFIAVMLSSITDSDSMKDQLTKQEDNAKTNTDCL